MKRFQSRRLLAAVAAVAEAAVVETEADAEAPRNSRAPAKTPNLQIPTPKRALFWELGIGSWEFLQDHKPRGQLVRRHVRLFERRAGSNLISSKSHRHGLFGPLDVGHGGG